MDISTGHEHRFTLCIFKNLTGIPCPGCGIGRGTLAFLNGNFKEAFNYNIISIPFSIAIICSIIWLCYDVIKAKDSFLRTINTRIKTIYLIPFFILTLISWVVNIYRGI